MTPKMPDSSSSERILIVDDDPVLQRMTSLTLQHHGYEVFLASDGEEGLEKAESVHPDLIILDVMMPKVDGWAFIKRLRAKPDFALVPVIFLTALSSPSKRIEGFKLGADDYLAKPFLPAELVQRVKNAFLLKGKIHWQAQEKSSASPFLAGSIQEIGLASVLTLLSFEQRSGILRVLHESQLEAAEIRLQKGNVIWARTEGESPLKNEEAFFSVLHWEAGTFEFKPMLEDFGQPGEMNQSISFLLLEGARRLDEGAC